MRYGYNSLWYIGMLNLALNQTYSEQGFSNKCLAYVLRNPEVLFSQKEYFEAIYNKVDYYLDNEYLSKVYSLFDKKSKEIMLKTVLNKLPDNMRMLVIGDCLDKTDALFLAQLTLSAMYLNYRFETSEELVSIDPAMIGEVFDSDVPIYGDDNEIIAYQRWVTKLDMKLDADGKMPRTVSSEQISDVQRSFESERLSIKMTDPIQQILSSNPYGYQALDRYKNLLSKLEAERGEVSGLQAGIYGF